MTRRTDTAAIFAKAEAHLHKTVEQRFRYLQKLNKLLLKTATELNALPQRRGREVRLELIKCSAAGCACCPHPRWTHIAVTADDKLHVRDLHAVGEDPVSIPGPRDYKARKLVKTLQKIIAERQRVLYHMRYRLVPEELVEREAVGFSKAK